MSTSERCCPSKRGPEGSIIVMGDAVECRVVGGREIIKFVRDSVHVLHTVVQD
jgi:hypothetical protein